MTRIEPEEGRIQENPRGITVRNQIAIVLFLALTSFVSAEDQQYVFTWGYQSAHVAPLGIVPHDSHVVKGGFHFSRGRFYAELDTQHSPNGDNDYGDEVLTPFVGVAFGLFQNKVIADIGYDFTVLNEDDGETGGIHEIYGFFSFPVAELAGFVPFARVQQVIPVSDTREIGQVRRVGVAREFVLSKNDVLEKLRLEFTLGGHDGILRKEPEAVAYYRVWTDFILKSWKGWQVAPFLAWQVGRGGLVSERRFVWWGLNLAKTIGKRAATEEN